MKIDYSIGLYYKYRPGYVPKEVYENFEIYKKDLLMRMKDDRKKVL